MSRSQKKMLLRILVSALLLPVAALLAPEKGVFRLLCFLVPYLVIGWDVLWRAVRNICHGQIFDENFLMCFATVGALAIGDYFEAAFVMLFYQIGELFQAYAVGRSRKSIAELMDIRPDYANIETEAGIRQAAPEEVEVGEIIVVRPGEKIPLDGVVTEGSSTLDTASLTGEAMPRPVHPGDETASGCVNQSGLLHIRVTKPFGESTVAKILELLENASAQKARAENFITRFARYYTPCVVIAAFLLAFLPPIFAGDFTKWLQRALTFLVISCPCALVISVPLSFFGGIGGASRRGILVKGGNYLEQLAKAEIIVFDKTGTLTQGTFSVAEICTESLPAERLLELAATAESYSSHPISLSLQAAYGKTPDSSRVTEVCDLPGRGIQATVDGTRIFCGNGRLMEELSLSFPDVSAVGTVVYVAIEQSYAGYILIADQVKPEAAAAIADLKMKGIRQTVMLTGDTEKAAAQTADTLGIDRTFAGLLPGDKVKKAEMLLSELSPGGKLLFVGDGVNDAPVLSRADVGIAMGAMGQDAAVEAADIVLMDDSLSKLPLAISIAKRTLRIVRQNIVFALSVKALVLVLGAFGLANMWAAVFADVGVAVLAILNAMRALQVK